MFKGKDGVWRTVGGIPVNAEQATRLDAKSVKAPLRSNSLINLPNGKRKQIEDHELRDDQVADRLLGTALKSGLQYLWLVSARERILYLSQLVAEAREMLAQAGGGWPPSRPIQDAPRDGTYVLLSGPEGKAVCRWHGGEHPMAYWQLKGSTLAFHNPGRFWDLPDD